MGDAGITPIERAHTGLCGDCAHAQRIESSRASVFLLCRRSASDPAFRKYPALPVRSCPGYERDEVTRE